MLASLWGAEVAEARTSDPEITGNGPSLGRAWEPVSTHHTLKNYESREEQG